jgi:hypothetical protein
MRNASDRTLVVRVPAGSMFEPDNDFVQPMIVRGQVAILLAPGQERELSLPAACADVHRAEPASHHAFTLRAPREDRLSRTARMLAENEIGYEVAQAAIWIVANNASSLDLARLVRTTTENGVQTGQRPIITYPIEVRARELLAEHGLDDD